MTSFRFSTARHELSEPERDVLVLAYSRDLLCRRVANPQRCWQIAVELGVAGRIGALRTEQQLMEIVGAEVGSRFRDAARRQAVKTLAHRATERALFEVSEKHRLPAMLLKGSALRHKGLVLDGARSACDVDILVHEGAVEAWQRALLAGDFTRDLQIDAPHHPVSVRSRTNVKVELHVRLPGIRLRGSNDDATLQALESTKLIGQKDGLPPQILLPELELLVAHLVVHGLDQHGFQPKIYPAMKLLGDVVDCGSGMNYTSWQTAHELISRAVSSSEVQCVETLANLLREGDIPSSRGRHSQTAKYLEHLIGSMSDERYRSELLLRNAAKEFREKGVKRAATDYLVSAFTLPEANLVKLDPTPGRSAVARRIMRPLKLAGRLGELIRGLVYRQLR